MKKRALVILFSALATMQLSACGAIEFKKPEIEISGPKVDFGATATVGDKTVGTKTVKTADDGEASYDISGDTVKATNFSFSIPDGVDVRATSNDEDSIVFNGFIFNKNGENVLMAMEGTYKEPITKDNYNEAVNALMRAGYGTNIDIDFTKLQAMVVMKDVFGDGNLYSILNEEGTKTTYIIKTGSNGEYLIANYSTYATDDEVLDSVYALGFEDLFNWINKQLYGDSTNTNETVETYETESSGDSNISFGNSDSNYDSDAYKTAEEQAIDIIRETRGNSDEYKEGSTPKIKHKNSEDVLKETQSAAKTSGDIGKYLITIDNKPYSVNVDSSLVSDSTDHIIFLDNGLESVSATITDSYVDVGDTEELQLELKSLEDVSGKKGQLGNVTFRNGQEDAYVIALEDDDWNKLEVYQPIQGYNHYIKVEITDFSKSYDVDTLINTYGLNTTT